MATSLEREADRYYDLIRQYRSFVRGAFKPRDVPNIHGTIDWIDSEREPLLRQRSLMGRRLQRLVDANLPADGDERANLAQSIQYLNAQLAEWNRQERVKVMHYAEFERIIDEITTCVYLTQVVVDMNMDGVHPTDRQNRRVALVDNVRQALYAFEV